MRASGLFVLTLATTIRMLPDEASPCGPAGPAPRNAVFWVYGAPSATSVVRDFDTGEGVALHWRVRLNDGAEPLFTARAPGPGRWLLSCVKGGAYTEVSDTPDRRRPRGGELLEVSWQGQEGTAFGVLRLEHAPVTGERATLRWELKMVEDDGPPSWRFGAADPAVDSAFTLLVSANGLRASRCLSTRWVDAAGHATRWSAPLCVDTSVPQGRALRPVN